MDEEILEEREWSVEDYLAAFDPQAPDTALIRQRSDRIQSIVIKKVRSGARLFEDATFNEKAGASYTIRTRL
jgi:hypothetical protein